jgi:hypothetical protein
VASSDYYRLAEVFAKERVAGVDGVRHAPQPSLSGGFE